MQRFDNKIISYINKHSSQADELLNQIDRETHLKVLRPQMLPGALQGKILEMISFMIKPKNILELGTFTGYSTLCLAKGLTKGGKIYTIEIDDELQEFTQSFFDKSELKNKIEFLIGDAKNIIPDLNVEFELIFIDADKRQYPEYYELALSKLKTGGFIIADDVLWYGKVNEKVNEKDLYTKGLVDFNEMVKKDYRVENVILPIRDGLNLIRKL